jgi:putative membrane protein
LSKGRRILFFLGITILLSGCAKRQQLSIADRTTRGETNSAPQDVAAQVETAKVQEIAVIQESEENHDSEGVQDDKKFQETEVTQDNEEIQDTGEIQESVGIQESADIQETQTVLEAKESSDAITDDDITYITEKLFITQINHIYYNAQDYLGKTIEYEGIFETYHYEDTNQSYYYVVRYGPGCCSNDSSAGFEIAWGEASITKPEENAWVKVRGVLQEYKEGEYTYLRLHVVSLEEMETRGQEYVEN